MSALYGSEANAISIHLAAVTSIDRDVEVHPRGTVGFAGARLVRAEPTTAGSALLAAHGKLARQITIAETFELSDEEIDAILDEPA
jgi:hypothetical protein